MIALQSQAVILVRTQQFVIAVLEAILKMLKTLAQCALSINTLFLAHQLAAIAQSLNMPLQALLLAQVNNKF